MTCVYTNFKLVREETVSNDGKSIIMHKDSQKENSSGCTFKVFFEDKNISVSTIGCFANIIEDLFSDCMQKTNGDIHMALEDLFIKMTESLASGTICNLMVFDESEEKVYVACLGHSQTLRYRKNNDGKYRLVWKLEFTDTPLIYIHKWTSTQVSDIWIQCSNDFLKSNLESLDMRLEEIAQHLDVCDKNYNVAFSLHAAQIESILKNSHIKDVNIYNSLTKVFML